MTIVHIGTSNLPVLFPLGGATERRIRELAVRQAAAGSKVVVYSAEDRAEVKSLQGAEIRAVECSHRGVVRNFEFMFKALRDARTLHPDVIHFHSQPEGAALAGRIACRGLLSYDFFEFRRGRKNPLFPLYRRALARFSRLLPVSDYCLRESAAYWSLPADRMSVVYNGVSLEQFRPDAAAGLARKRAAGANGEFVFLYVGRVCLQKGTDLLIEACRRLLSEGRKIRLAVAGPVGQFGNEGGGDLTRRVAEMGGLYLGAVDEDLLPAVYNMCDAFVMPTRAYEMFGMAAIEAQACGKPVVYSNHGGLPEVIPAESGLPFDSGDAASLAHRLRRLMDDPALNARLSQAALRNAQRFAWENIAARLDRLYREN